MIAGESSDEDEVENCEEFLSNVKRTKLIKSDAQFDKEAYQVKKNMIQEILTLERTNELAKKLKSKRSLQIMLKLDEMDYEYTAIQKQ